jgi:hypothetical protein
MESQTHLGVVQPLHNLFHIDAVGELSPSNSVERLFRRGLGQSEILEAFLLREELSEVSAVRSTGSTATHRFELLPTDRRGHSLHKHLPLLWSNLDSRRFLGWRSIS